MQHQGQAGIVDFSIYHSSKALTMRLYSLTAALSLTRASRLGDACEAQTRVSDSADPCVRQRGLWQTIEAPHPSYRASIALLSATATDALTVAAGCALLAGKTRGSIDMILM